MMGNSRLALLVLGGTAIGFVLGWGVAGSRQVGAKVPETDRAAATPRVMRAEPLAASPPAPTKLLSAEDTSVAERLREFGARPASLERKASMLAWVRTLSPEQCRTAAVAARRMKERIGRELLEMVATRWAEIDPVGAVQDQLSLGAARWTELDEYFLQNVMLAWAAHDAAHAEEWLAAQPVSTGRVQAEAMFALALAERDPARAFQFLRESTLGAEAGESAAGAVLKTWARRDPQGAIAAMDSFPWSKDAPWRKYAEVAQGWAERDPQAALAWISTLPINQTNPYLLLECMGTWAKQDPAGAFAWLQSQPEVAHRDELLAAALSATAKVDPELAQAQLRLLPAGAERDRAVQSLAREMMRGQPRAAAALLEGEAPSHERDRTAQMIAVAWSVTEPGAAMEWLSWQVTLSREINLEQIFSNWLGSAPDAALGWARALPAGQNRSVALGTMASALAKTDVAAAQRLFSEMDPFGQAIAGTSIAQALSQQSVAGALQWAGMLPEGAARNDAYGQVAIEWARKDAAGGTAWLNTMRRGPARDRAIEGFAAVVVETNPEYAVMWIGSVQDDQHRAQLLEQAFGNWLRNDPAKARAWAAGTPALTEGQRQRLLRF